ncbi:hypothetical protein [Citrobacter sp. RHBSTW-00127]|uniref:hypothetical protein n=1 Tax=Citrobacter sp. RHBSTW-00127 TaxID=2742636 RepID=UPI002017AE90|nr:hypothetical protein [Citrobacter sp. RHBSTW-00127]
MSNQEYEQAFPTRDDNYDSKYSCPGMTLRDYMAAKALQGLCANPGGPFQANDMSGWAIVNCELDDIATESYKLADAMLKAREAS